jgi:hypothetical protein
MTKKSRYLLILVGFIIFLIGAPLIVLYVRGLSIDFATGKFVPTGILAVRSEPAQSAIYINEKLKKDREGDIKFLKPGEYDLVLKHVGYFDWYKRISVRPNEVAWAQGESNKIHLLYNDKSPGLLGENVSDFHIFGNNLAYINGNNFVFTSLQNSSQSDNLQLPVHLERILASPDNNLYLLTSATSTYLFDRRNKNFEDLTSVIPPNSEYKFSPQNQLYALLGSNLYTVTSGADKRLIAENVKQFAFQENSLYYVKSGKDLTYLVVRDIGSDSEFPVLSPFPTFNTVDLLVNYQREILVFGDKTLYKINATLEKLADNISGWKYDERVNTLVLIHSGELSYYNFGDKKLDLINRSSSPANHALLEPELRYVFFVQDNRLKALEIDKRGHQNSYVLTDTTDFKKMMLDGEKKHLLILDGNKIKRIRIR